MEQQTDPWITLTKNNVYDYLKGVDFSHPDFNLKVLKEQLSNFLGVVPAVKMKWNTVETINELKRDSGALDFKTAKDKLEQIEIVFVDTENKPKSFKFIF